ncbi:hypothetical protein ACU4HD_13755 [Cupriavidus basilensis]
MTTLPRESEGRVDVVEWAIRHRAVIERFWALSASQCFAGAAGYGGREHFPEGAGLIVLIETGQRHRAGFRAKTRLI